MARKKKKPTSRKGKKKRSGGKSGSRASKAAKDAAADLTATETAEPSTRSSIEEEASAGAAVVEPLEERAPEEPLPLGAADDDDDLSVIDLDAEEVDDPIDRLIAETVATATPEEALEPHLPVVDLDAELLEALREETADDATPADRDRTQAEEGAAAHGGEPELARDEALQPAATTSDAEVLAQEEIPSETARRLADVGPVSSPEMRSRLLAEALAHAEHKDARYRIPFSSAVAIGRWKALAGTVILALAALFAIAPPRWARPEPPLRLAEEERVRNLRAALLLQAQQVESFRVRTQRLPSTLDEVGEMLPGMRYVRSGTRAYQLIAYEPNGSAVVYDSTDPGAAFAELTIGWAPRGGSP